MFAPESFGELTIDVVLQALEQGQKMRRQDAHMGELGVATLTSCFINANRDPKKGQPAKPSDFFYFSQSETLDPAIANAFFSLITDKKLPPWIVHASPIDLLRQSKTTGYHAKQNRLWLGNGVAIFRPEVNEKELFTDFAVFSGEEWGWQKVTDVDTGKTLEVFVIPSEYEQQYCRDLTLKTR